ncbi:hypothetical protein TIFTF001_015252 [Ficus carica]|uniref:Uncharacterized protein n=1 Tax=Ficus carica TaxID=3494 RepID=A0AA88AL88_FICCA|nr:hypothetical protein TIFTF001_015252 [Ficus carica]
MAQPNAVEIVEICTVAPPLPAATDLSPKSLPLTFFDICWTRLPPSERLFFYEFPFHDHSHSISNTTTFFHSNIIPTLKHSLSLSLHHFLPLVGNLTWPSSSLKPVLEYTHGDAVPFTIAQSIDTDFHRLSSTDILCKATEIHSLVPKLSVSHERSAVLAIQVTLFPNIGFCIGISSHHAVVDGKSFTSFLRLWAHVSKSSSLGGGESPITLPLELKPSYDQRTPIKDTLGFEEMFSNQWLNIEGPNNRSLMPTERPIPQDSIRGTFRIPREKIEKLRQVVNKEEHQLLAQVSTFSLTCAYTWVCLVKAEGNSDNKMIALSFAVDCRSRLDPPLPATYFGNCLAGKGVVVEREVLVGKEGFVFAVNAISGDIKSLENGLVDLTGMEKMVPALARKETRIVVPRSYYTIAGSSRFEVYKTDFGWGQPKKVDAVSIDKTGAICLSDTRDEDGIEIGLVLNPNHMEVFASLFAEGLQSL